MRCGALRSKEDQCFPFCQKSLDSFDRSSVEARTNEGLLLMSKLDAADERDHEYLRARVCQPTLADAEEIAQTDSKRDEKVYQLCF